MSDGVRIAEAIGAPVLIDEEAIIRTNQQPALPVFESNLFAWRVHGAFRKTAVCIERSSLGCDGVQVAASVLKQRQDVVVRQALFGGEQAEHSVLQAH